MKKKIFLIHLNIILIGKNSLQDMKMLFQQYFFNNNEKYLRNIIRQTINLENQKERLHLELEH